MHNLKVEDYVLIGSRAEDLSLENNLTYSSEGLLQRGKGGARIHRRFCNKNQAVRTCKDYCKLEKTRHLNVVLFYVWEDARVWAH